MVKLNERIKELRKALDLTLEKFGANLGVTKTTISRLEKGERSLTDQMFISICREYRVNPDWLENGTGPMFLEKMEDDEYMAAAVSLSEDSLVASCLIEYAKLREDERAVVKKYVEGLMERYKKDAT